MSIEKRKLFQFVSKLIFDTKQGDVVWQKHDTKTYTPPFFKDGIHCDNCFYISTPDNKMIWIFRKPNMAHPAHSLKGMDEYRSKPIEGLFLNSVPEFRYLLWLELRNCELELEFTIDISEVNSLGDLYHVIREQQEQSKTMDEYLDTQAAEHTIDLILNASRETTTH